MNSDGIHERPLHPRLYKGFHVAQTHGRFYGIPAPLELDDLLLDRLLYTHPRVLSASTREELLRLIDDLDPRADVPFLLTHYKGHELVRHRSNLYGVPLTAGEVDLDLATDRQRHGVVSGDSVEDLQGRIDDLEGSETIEFAGWLPVYEMTGNCGRHPQFQHTSEPPQGYRFTVSAPARHRPSWLEKLTGAAFTGARKLTRQALLTLRPLLTSFLGGPRVGIRVRLRVFAAMVRMFITLRRGGASTWTILNFIRTRHYVSQLLLGQPRQLVFLTSMPFTFGQNPWVIEVEDVVTLFHPFVHNGFTGDLRIRQLPAFPIVKALLESQQCKGIITHMRSTARMLPTLFGSEQISNKVFYAPLGVKLPQRWQRHSSQSPAQPIDLLFVNSWHQLPQSFLLRGGLDILEAFAILRRRYPQLRLTLRTHLPELDPCYHRIIESGWVRVIDRFLSPEEMAELHVNSHIYLLPAARVHIVSLLQAMSYGLAVVTSDGWGIEEYISHERNGLIVKGRHGKASWVDHEEGLLREDYECMLTPDQQVIDGLVNAISRLVEDVALRAQLGRAAREDVQTRFNMQQWNKGLKNAFDAILASEACGSAEETSAHGSLLSPRTAPADSA